MKLLVGEFKSKTDVKDRLGVSPRQLASLNDHTSIVRYFRETSDSEENVVGFVHTVELILFHVEYFVL